MRRLPLFSAMTILAVVFFAGAARVWAGPITGGPGVWPFTKLGVYQGVVSISPISSGTMELGSSGKDIAATGQIIIRPNGVTAVKGATFLKQSSSTQLKVPGKIWLYPSGPSQPPVAYSQWPSGSSSQWIRVPTTPSGLGTPYEVLQTSTPGLGMRIGAATAPVTGDTALHVSEEYVPSYDIYGLEVAHSVASEYAVQLQGDLVTQSTQQAGTALNVAGRILINGQEVYHPGGNYSGIPTPVHQGIGSGLDADYLDGYDVTIENGNGTSCTGIACLCFQFNGSIGKKCTALTNYM